MLKVPPDAGCALQTRRLKLSPMIASDAGRLYELLKEPALYSFIGDAPPASVEALRERIRAWEKRHSPDGSEVWLNWTVRLTHDSSVIGYMQAGITEATCDLAWVIGLPFQNQGYATEAMQEVASWLKERFAVREFRASIHPQHIASQRIAEHLGLRRTSETTPEGEQVWAVVKDNHRAP
jgi:RimJ/RimL family protein N-acetyltransferase